MSVSYTHLDVYKRQDADGGPAAGEHGGSGALSGTSAYRGAENGNRDLFMCDLADLSDSACRLE